MKTKNILHSSKVVGVYHFRHHYNYRRLCLQYGGLLAFIRSRDNCSQNVMHGKQRDEVLDRLRRSRGFSHIHLSTAPTTDLLNTTVTRQAFGVFSTSVFTAFTLTKYRCIASYDSKYHKKIVHNVAPLRTRATHVFRVQAFIDSSRKYLFLLGKIT